MINVDGIQVKDEEEATHLMLYHLQMAANFFEATHDDRGRRANELIRENLMLEPASQGASSFIEVLCTYYEGLSVEDEEIEGLDVENEEITNAEDE